MKNFKIAAFRMFGKWSGATVTIPLSSYGRHPLMRPVCQNSSWKGHIRLYMKNCQVLMYILAGGLTMYMMYSFRPGNIPGLLSIGTNIQVKDPLLLLNMVIGNTTVSYTHLTLPTKR